MIEKLEETVKMSHARLGWSYEMPQPATEIVKKLNEIIDHLNNSERARSLEGFEKNFDAKEYLLSAGLEPKWKLGDNAWWINTFDSGSCNHWTVDNIKVDELLLEEYKNGDLNLFKDAGQAMGTLDQIKEVMKKYQ